MIKTNYDVAIIGAGPGGLNAALYASRAGLKVVLIEKYMVGGKVIYSSKIENWLGDTLVEGAEFADRIYNHSVKYGAETIFNNVKSVENLSDKKKIIHFEDGSKIEAKTVIIASGTRNREPRDIINFDRFNLRGIYYCATCDGPLFKNKEVAVIGGGNSAIEETEFLAKFTKKVYLIVRDNKFNAESMLVDSLKKYDNIEIHMNSSVKEIKGTDQIESIVVQQSSKEIELNISAIFAFIGLIPNSEFVNDLNIVGKNHFIPTNEKMETSVNGIYAIGDVRDKLIRQIITAASDGAIAAKHIQEYLS
ncbi:NAD(P)/FAD-dependent oxidoreductase [Mycoplasma sp. Mirounga ES2805-ORL]|uniref:NAD(P)/FAD-dependent oxidoreductase n=1 Tax=Mycoplasma sp. Mirounga ES2805-ORL TaxID=754514 RepID=UPI00197C1745|nr:FAD-dependent oxidoreductase [Mycoplasma sp. Mirounga ES2805-ORL]QSF13448.1 FAD-dependent oxidoreductase [Mycoplasma sp. Mirounga ES2805-ORL]